MNNIIPITVGEYVAKVQDGRSAVGLPDIGVPVEAFLAYRGTLDAEDADRIFLWFEYQKFTAGNTGKLTDLLPDAAIRDDGIKSLAEGNLAKGFGPVDLRKAKKLEPMLVTSELMDGPLQGIDGNHRLSAQFITGKSFDGVNVYVCEHPNMMSWPYMIEASHAYKARRLKARKLP